MRWRMRQRLRRVSECSYFQPNRAHELKRIRAVGNAGSELVVEVELAGAEAVAEMHVCAFGMERCCDLCKGEIVRGDESDGMAGEQATEQRLSGNAAIVRIGAGEQLIEQEEGRLRGGEIGDLLQTLNLRIKAREAALERVLHRDGCAYSDRRQAEAAAADRRSALSQNHIQADGTQQRALAGHVGTADDDEPARSVEREIVCNCSGTRQERMRETDRFQRRSVSVQRGEPAGWPLVNKARERAERFEVADAREPRAHVTAMTAAPVFYGE